MKEAQKNLISQNDVSNALDLGDANRKKQKNLKRLIKVI